MSAVLVLPVLLVLLLFVIFAHQHKSQEKVITRSKEEALELIQVGMAGVVEGQRWRDICVCS